MSVCKPNNGLQLWFILSLHDDGCGLRLNDDRNAKLPSIGLVPDAFLVLGPPHCVYRLFQKTISPTQFDHF